MRRSIELNAEKNSFDKHEPPGIQGELAFLGCNSKPRFCQLKAKKKKQTGIVKLLLQKVKNKTSMHIIFAKSKSGRSGEAIIIWNIKLEIFMFIRLQAWGQPKCISLHNIKLEKILFR